MFSEAFGAGLWASVGSTLGKLSGTSEFVVSPNIFYSRSNGSSSYSRDNLYF